MNDQIQALLQRPQEPLPAFHPEQFVTVDLVEFLRLLVDDRDRILEESYQAKQAGRKQAELYEARLAQKQMEIHDLERRLRLALDMVGCQEEVLERLERTLREAVDGGASAAQVMGLVLQFFSGARA